MNCILLSGCIKKRSCNGFDSRKCLLAKSCAAFDQIKAGKSFQQRLRELKRTDDQSDWKLIVAL